MNKQVMKYDVCWDGTMKPEPDGDWIEIEDFEALEARTEKAEAERADLLEALKEVVSEYDNTDNGRSLRWAIDEARAAIATHEDREGG